MEFADQRFKTAILILASAYYKPTVQEMLNEYLKAVNLLTINEENRLKQKVETLEIEKSQLATLQEDDTLFKNRQVMMIC